MYGCGCAIQNALAVPHLVDPSSWRKTGDATTSSDLTFKKCALKVKIRTWNSPSQSPGSIGRKPRDFPRLKGSERLRGSDWPERVLFSGFYLGLLSSHEIQELCCRTRGQRADGFCSESLSIKQMGHRTTHHSSQVCKSKFLAYLKSFCSQMVNQDNLCLVLCRWQT